jgi:hypothetical protein
MPAEYRERMKNFLGIAVVAAIAGAVVTVLMKQRSRRPMGRSGGELAEESSTPPRTRSLGFTVEELIAEQPEGPRTLN